MNKNNESSPELCRLVLLPLCPRFRWCIGHFCLSLTPRAGDVFNSLPRNFRASSLKLDPRSIRSALLYMLQRSLCCESILSCTHAPHGKLPRTNCIIRRRLPEGMNTSTTTTTNTYTANTNTTNNTSTTAANTTVTVKVYRLLRKQSVDY